MFEDDENCRLSIVKPMGGDYWGNVSPPVIYQGGRKRIRPPNILKHSIQLAQIPVEVWYNYNVSLSLIFTSAAQQKQFQF